MNNDSKIPSWLQDKKKLIILGIVIFAVMLSGFNSYSIAGSLADKLEISDAINEASLKSIVKSVFSSSKLEGTYQNLYADECLMFNKDGTMVYTYGSTVIFGEYEIEGQTLRFELEGYDYEFDILTNDGTSLNLSMNGYEYNYSKLY